MLKDATMTPIYSLFLLAAMLLQQPKASASLDYQVYVTRVEPILLKTRDGNGPGGSCFACHAHVTSRLRLQPVSSGTPSWTDAQSRRNFEAVIKLVTPGDPLKSRLLLHPLAVDAGGDPVHAGGKHWSTQNDPEWQTLASWVRAATAEPPKAEPPLDFEVFRTRVQAILLEKRTGHARCYTCHSQGTNFRLQALSSGSTTWNEEQSRRNFESVQRLVVPNDPQSSRLLMIPLAAEAGGDPFHPGGKFWSSRNDPEWQMLSAWVRRQPVRN